MNSELEVLRDVAQRLEGAGIPYMLTGSVAMSYYAEPRMTRDLDLVVELGAGDVHRVIELFSADFYVSDEAVSQAIAHQGMFNLFHLSKFLKVDLIIRKDSEYRRLEFSRKKRVELGGFTAWVVSAEDLILSKLVWAQAGESAQQLRDVQNLLEAAAERQYLNDWAARLGVNDLLLKCLDAGYKP